MIKAHTAAPNPLRGWSKAIAARQRTVLHRVACACASAIVFAPLIGTITMLGWLATYMVIIAIEWIVVRPERGKDGMAPTGLVGFMTDCILFMAAAMFAWIMLPLWFVGGLFGGICATIYLGAGLLQSVISGAGSSRVTSLTVAPSAIASLSIPWMLHAYGANLNQIVAASTAVAVFLIFCYAAALRLKTADQAHASMFALAQAKRLEAEQATDRRTAYLSMVAHDLRTPITAILTGAQSLKTDSQSSTSLALQKLDMIEEAGVMMNALLNDLLDHARIDAGRMSLNEQAFDLRQLLTQTVRLWSGPIKSKGLKLVLETAPDLPRTVIGDEMRLRQILNNLLSNAVKFTDSGTITFRAQSWQDDNGQHAITLEVEDTGSGMDSGQLSRLFNRFDQTSDDIAARYGGSGLGLSISHDLVLLMKGRLTARSSQGTGTIFTIALNLFSADESTPVSLPAQGLASDVLASLQYNANPIFGTVSPLDASPVSDDNDMPEIGIDTLAPAVDIDADGAPLRVLVVDDHEINRRAIQLILQPFDCDITTAADGLSALELAATKTFDVILMDVRMPELDGRETTRRLRAAGGPNLHTPVIAVTADNSAEDQSACLAAGMDGFVAKPLSPSTLIAALQTTLEKHQQRVAA